MKIKAFGLLAVLVITCLAGSGSAETGNISVNSSPSDATIYLDGSDIAQKTPFMLTNISIGEHIVNVSLVGYIDPAPQTVNVTSGDTVTADFTLTPKNGSISVSSNPSNAIIYLDGSDTAQKTPAILSVAAGEHIVSVSFKLFLY